MVVNFKARGISRGARKLARTNTLIIIKNIGFGNRRKNLDFNNFIPILNKKMQRNKQYFHLVLFLLNNYSNNLK